MKNGGGGGGSARTSRARSSEGILEELRRNLEDVAGLTSLFSEDLLPPFAAPPAADAAVLLLFFFLLPCPCCCWFEFGFGDEESLALSLPLKLGLGGFEVEERCGSRRRGEWRSMNRLLLPPVLAMTEVASAEVQEMEEMEGRPSLLCTPLRRRDAMDC